MLCRDDVVKPGAQEGAGDTWRRRGWQLLGGGGDGMEDLEGMGSFLCSCQGSVSHRNISYNNIRYLWS